MVADQVKTISCTSFSPRIMAFTTIKSGGFLTSKYGGANFGYNTNESSLHIDNNYRTLLKSNSIEKLTILKQTHSNICHVVTKGNYAAINGCNGDALVTKESNIALGILTADCYPVLIEGDQNIAALHCGWRGTVSGIIESVANYFIKDGDSMNMAFIGAGIGRCCYEVKDDFIDDVEKSGHNTAKYLLRFKDKYCFDLHSLIIDILLKSGVKSVHSHDICTVHDRRFFSYRRDKGDTGRMLTVIMRGDRG